MEYIIASYTKSMYMCTSTLSCCLCTCPWGIRNKKCPGWINCNKDI